MFRTHRTIALIASIALAGGVAAAAADSPVKRLGKTVVQYREERVKAVLSWRYANQTFEKEPWLLLEVAFAAEAKPVDLNREDVSLVMPSGERLSLPSQKRFAEGCRDPRRIFESAAVTREPVADYFPRATHVQRLPFFSIPSENLVLDQVGGGPNLLTHGDLFFEAPAGPWKPGSYTLVLKNKSMNVELPFTLPADDPKPEAKAEEGKAAPW